MVVVMVRLWSVLPERRPVHLLEEPEDGAELGGGAIRAFSELVGVRRRRLAELQGDFFHQSVRDDFGWCVVQGRRSCDRARRRAPWWASAGAEPGSRCGANSMSAHVLLIIQLLFVQGPRTAQRGRVSFSGVLLALGTELHHAAPTRPGVAWARSERARSERARSSGF